MKKQSDFFVEIIVVMVLILTIVKVERERTELEAKHDLFKIEESFLPAACSTQVERQSDKRVKSSLDL